uniref:Uncharacterized protein n=1 Tax=Sinocyclocheilus grahami TaxID=75366 RepID=A0A672LBP6_SINGR
TPERVHTSRTGCRARTQRQLDIVVRKRSSGELSDSLTPDPNNLLGRRIQHSWREKGALTKWKGTVLDRLIGGSVVMRTGNKPETGSSTCAKMGSSA